MGRRSGGRSRAEERLIRIMTRKGGKGFRILRSAEVAPKKYRRATMPEGGEGR